MTRARRKPFRCRARWCRISVETAILLDIDGTLLDLAPTPREVFVPAGLAETLKRLLKRTSGALALVSGRSLNDVDLIFAPDQFPVVGGHGAEMRLSTDNEAVATHAPPMDKELKLRLAAIAKLSPGILLEDKGYSLALHYRLAPQAEKAIYDAVSQIRAELPNAAIEVLPGKCVCEIKHAGFTKATGVLELMNHEPFKGRTPVLYRRRCHRRIGVRDHARFWRSVIFGWKARSGRGGSFRRARRCPAMARASARRRKRLATVITPDFSWIRTVLCVFHGFPSNLLREPGGVPSRPPEFGLNSLKG